MSDAPVTVVVVDDHPFFRDGVKRGLAQSPQIQVVGEAGNGVEALALLRTERPAVAVVDYQMPQLDGVGLVRALAHEQLPTRVLLLSAFTDSTVVYKAMEEGAAGYLSKDAPRTEIVDAVLKIARGQTVLPPELAGALVAQIRLRAAPEVPVLSERELQVLQGFARGLSIPQVGAELFLGASTVKTYTARLYEKLGVADRAQAVAEAMRRGLLD
ncbi:response regulator transcription factor [Arthrobacter sp. 35W]|uniref:response regulator transcription factor n=1 Tax=Arthrobacter sp. 35W TaxID=1132441 RepID=UPI00040ADBDE|nr:response regulator transcription factor [Arthrobacter sp. 35W]